MCLVSITIKGNPIICAEYSHCIVSTNVIVGTNGFVQGIVAILVTIALTTAFFGVYDIFQQVT